MNEHYYTPEKISSATYEMSCTELIGTQHRARCSGLTFEEVRSIFQFTTALQTPVKSLLPVVATYAVADERIKKMSRTSHHGT
jgi:hypothetical protein